MLLVSIPSSSIFVFTLPTQTSSEFLLCLKFKFLQGAVLQTLKTRSRQSQGKLMFTDNLSCCCPCPDLITFPAQWRIPTLSSLTPRCTRNRESQNKMIFTANLSNFLAMFGCYYLYLLDVFIHRFRINQVNTRIQLTARFYSATSVDVEV